MRSRRQLRACVKLAALSTVCRQKAIFNIRESVTVTKCPFFYSIDDGVSRKHERFAGNCRRASGGYSSKQCPTTLSKDARRAVIDRLRSKRIAAVTQSSSMGSDDDISESSTSKDEYSDTDSDYSSDESSNGERDNISPLPK